MNNIRILILTLLLFVGFLIPVGKSPEWFGSLPRFDYPPHNANEFFSMLTTNLPTDTVNKYIEQKANYNKGSLVNDSEYGDTICAYDVYGVYETDTVTILYYKVTHANHKEIKVALNPFVARFPSTLPLYWCDNDENAYPSRWFEYSDGIFKITSQVSYFDFLKIVTQEYCIDASSNQFKRLSHAEELMELQ